MEDKSIKKCGDCVHHRVCKSWDEEICPWRNGLALQEKARGCESFMPIADALADYPQAHVKDVILLSRRQKLFSALGDIYQNEQDSPKTKAYIFALWRYIADVHGEEICIEIEEDENG